MVQHQSVAMRGSWRVWQARGAPTVRTREATRVGRCIQQCDIVALLSQVLGGAKA